MPTMDEFARNQRTYNDLPQQPLDVEPGTLDMDIIHEMVFTLKKDRVNFVRYKNYLDGKHLKPYAPRRTTAQIRDIQKRSITNLMPLLVALPAQVLFCDGYRRGDLNAFGLEDESTEPKGDEIGDDDDLPEWGVWQRNQMDARQSILYRSAFTYGHSFLHVNNLDPDNIRLEILPTRHTVAYWEDPVNDARPSLVLTHKTAPRRDGKAPGLAIAWDDTYRYELHYTAEGEYDQVGSPIAHGLTGTPVVRYVCMIDDEGYTTGLIENAIASQDRVNQSVFSTNITSDFGAFKVRTAAGLQVQYKQDPTTGELALDADGQPIPVPIEISQAQLLISDSPDTKFGQLDETPLQGYLLAEEQAMKNMAAVSQFPPHALMGTTVANISAEALQALEAQWWRFIEMVRHQFGESNEEVLRIVAEALGDEAGAKAWESEALWRDMTFQSFPAMMDALGKAVQMIGFPRKAAWQMIPGATQGTVEVWEDMYEQQQIDDAHSMVAGPAAGAARQGAKDLAEQLTQPYETPFGGGGGLHDKAQSTRRSFAGDVTIGGPGA